MNIFMIKEQYLFRFFYAYVIRFEIQMNPTREDLQMHVHMWENSNIKVVLRQRKAKTSR